MDAVEFGAYMSLLIACYQTHNKLPIDDKRLARMARVTPHKWASIKGVVLEKFSLNGDTYEQKFVKKEIQRIESLSKKNQTNALKRYDTDLPVAERTQCQTPANINNKEQVTKNKEKEKIDKKEKDAAKRGSRLPPDWELCEEWGDWAVSQGLSVDDVLREEQVFRDYWVSLAGSKATKLDWEATWRNWIRRKLNEF